MPDVPREPTVIRWLADLSIITAALSVIISAMLYVGGFSYLYHFMAHFDAGLVILDLPHELYLNHGAGVMSRWRYVVGGFVLALAVGLLSARYWSARPQPEGFSKPPDPWSEAASVLRRPTIYLVAAVLLAFLIMPTLAIETAIEDFEAQGEAQFELNPSDPRSVRHPRVRIHQTEFGSLGASDADALSSGCYRLLVQAGDKLLLFFHPPGKRAESYELTLMSFSPDLLLETLSMTFKPDPEDCGQQVTEES